MCLPHEARAGRDVDVDRSSEPTLLDHAIYIPAK